MRPDFTRCKRDKDLYWYKDKNVKKKYAFRYRYKNKSGKYTEKSEQNFDDENSAYHALLTVKAAVASEDYNEVEMSTLTISAWIDMYIESKKKEWKPNTYTNRVLYADKHIKPLIGHFKLVKLDRVTYIRVFINTMLENFKPGTVRTIHDFFKQVVNAAIDVEILKRNRFTKIQIKEKENKAPNVLTAAQLAQFLTTMKQTENETAIMTTLLLAHTGMRIGEAFGLQWSDIDFENQTAAITKTRDSYGTRTPKTTNSLRTVNLPNSVVQELQKYRTFCKKLLLFHGMKFKEDSFILISPNSAHPYGNVVYRNALIRVNTETGLDVKPHTFRHTFATILISQGIDAVTVAKILGNTATMVYKVYAHALENQTIKATNIIEQSIGIL